MLYYEKHTYYIAMDRSMDRFVLGISSIGKELHLYVCDARGTSRRSVSVWKSADGVSFDAPKGEMFFTKLLGSLRTHPDISDVFRISSVSFPEETLILFYKKKEKDGTSRVFSARSRDGLEWSRVTEADSIRELGTVVDFQRGGDARYGLFFGERTIKLALSSDLKRWNVRRASLLKPREHFFDEGPLSIGAAVPAGNGILIFYVSENREGRQCIGSALVGNSDPKTVLWRTEEPLWMSPNEWLGKDVRFVGAVPRVGKVLLYWSVDGKLFVEEIEQFWKVSRGSAVSIVPDGAKLERYQGNPILASRKTHDWEFGEVFNPAAFLSDDGMVHILYRAIGKNGLSTVGYANSRDGFLIHERLDVPIYVSSPTLDDVKMTRIQEPCTTPYASGGGWGGSEDPKVTRVEDTLYMTYTAFDGYNFPRVALTKISVSDFLAKKWNWSRPVMISPPGEIHKNWTIFPEKIHGKFAVLHSISPEVRIDYFDTLDFDGETFIKSEHVKTPLKGRWELLVRGVGPSPIKTKAGWLILYHATTHDCGYKLGAMLLDKKDPTVVIARSKTPILEPQVWYENEGSKPRIVYSCGAVVKDETLFVYYGSADTVTCVATVPLARLLDALLHANKAVPTRYVKLGNE